MWAVLGRVLWVVVVLCAAQMALAQDATPTQAQPSQILTIDRARLFAETRFGKAVAQRFDAASVEHLAENRKLEAALEAEERSLTVQRETLPADQFRVLADAFDAKVEALRTAQDAKSRGITRQRDEDQQRFFETALPILGDLMAEKGAVAILEKSTLVAVFDRIDITADAIARIDAALGDGTTAPAPAP